MRKENKLKNIVNKFSPKFSQKQEHELKDVTMSYTNTNTNRNENNRILRLKQNMGANYIYSFFKNFDISSAIWVLYLDYRGMSLLQIGLLEGIFHVASMLFEVPSGAIADLFGRKKVMIVGRLLFAVAALLQISSSGFWLFAVAFIINALSYNLNSGTQEAFVYDTMKELKTESGYQKVSANMNMIIEVSSGIATFVGGVIAQYSYTLCYTFIIALALASIVPLVKFLEPEPEPDMASIGLENRNEPKGEIRLWTHAKICYEICRKEKDILRILFFFPFVETCYMILYFYGQKYFSNLGLNKVQISLVMLSVGIMSCLGAYFSIAIEKRWKQKTRYIVAPILAVAISCFYLKIWSVSVIGFGFASFLNAVLYPIQSNALNSKIPSKQRATILSISSMLYSIFMVLLFPFCGYLAEVTSLNLVFAGIGIGLFAFAFFTAFFDQKEYNRTEKADLEES